MMRTVEPDAWVGTLASLKADGHTLLDLLTAVDRVDAVEFIAHVVDPGTLDRVVVTTVVADASPRLDTATPVFPGAAWHERETAEMFGVTFDGHPDPRPLLLREAPDVPPLRKAAPLPARLEVPWPGVAEESGTTRARRPQLPPGVRAEWVEQA